VARATRSSCPAATALLIFYRLLDKPGLHGNDRLTATVGVEWGIFIALLLALGIVYAGARIRALERPQPPLRRSRPRERAATRATERAANVERDAPADTDATVLTRARAHQSAPVPASRQQPEPPAPRGRPRFPPAPGEQLSFEDPPARSER
jgi:hypothetical protein